MKSIRGLCNHYRLMHHNRAVGRELVAAAQSELTIGNLVRRVLFLIREEYVSQVK
jgi:translation initiation factor eIF-2B subunit beta